MQNHVLEKKKREEEEDKKTTKKNEKKKKKQQLCFECGAIKVCSLNKQKAC
jgi:hypothetical protein